MQLSVTEPLPLLTPMAYQVATLSKTSLTLVGGVLIVLIAGIVGSVLYRRKRKASSKKNKQSSTTIPVDTTLLPRIPHQDVVTALHWRDLPQLPETPLTYPVPSPVSKTADASASFVPPETPMPGSLPDGYNNMRTPPRAAQRPLPALSTAPSQNEHLPDTPRPHPKVNSSKHPHQKQLEYEAMLEAMIRQAQRGIFATPGKDDLS